MFRRVVAHAVAPVALCRHVTLSADTREGLTKPLSSLKEECKGQNLDLADMAEAMKGATYALQEVLKKSAVDDKQFKGKTATLAASLKAYNTRLGNLQNETRSIQAEIDGVLKLLWGTEKPHGAQFSTPPPNKAPAAAEDFEVEPPPLARALGEEAPSAPASAAAAEPTVERVEAERVDAAAASSTADKVTEQEIEVETLEVDVEPPAPEDPVDTMKVTDITQELYERGVNFSDCMDARTLRQRYRDVLSGKVPTTANQAASSKRFTEPLTENTSQPRMPPRGAPPPHQYQYQQQQQQQQQQSGSNNAGSGITSDPYPNAHRKMVDPMKFVHEIKQELAVEKGIDASSVDLWSGKVKLEDHKRLYDYPSIQSYPIEVRQKGDVPS